MSVMMCHGCRAKVMLQEDRETLCPKCGTQLTIKTPVVIFVRSSPGEGPQARGGQGPKSEPSKGTP